MTRYGLRYKIIADNATQFESQEFTEYCWNHRIIKSFSSVAHPQANGVIGAANKIVKACLKKRLNRTKDNWAEELPFVSWSYKTNSKTSIGHTSFSLVYDYEVMLL